MKLFPSKKAQIYFIERPNILLSIFLSFSSKKIFFSSKMTFF